MKINFRLFAKKKPTIQQETIRRMLSPGAIALYDSRELDLKAKELGLESKDNTKKTPWLLLKVF